MVAPGALPSNFTLFLGDVGISSLESAGLRCWSTFAEHLCSHAPFGPVFVRLLQHVPS